MKFFIQNVRNEKYNVKYTRAARWINSEISNRDKNTALSVLSLLLVIIMMSLLKAFNAVELQFLFKYSWLYIHATHF